MNAAKELRERIGHRSWQESDEVEVKLFLIQLSREFGIERVHNRFAFHVVEEMSDEELLARWARHMIERNSG